MGLRFVTAAAFAAGLLAAGCARKDVGSSPGGYGAVPDFALIDAQGNRVTLRDLEGGPWVASFLFTRCAGQCPMMAAGLKSLAQRAPGLRFVSFSLDPADTPGDLARFATRYGAQWTFLTGGPGVVQKLSRDGFKLAAAEGGDARETIIHSSKLVLVDAQGSIQGYFDALDSVQVTALLERAQEILR